MQKLLKLVLSRLSKHESKIEDLILTSESAGNQALEEARKDYHLAIQILEGIIEATDKKDA